MDIKDPGQHASESVPPNDTPSKESNAVPNDRPVVAAGGPPGDPSHSNHKAGDSKPNWKTVFEFVAILTGIGLLLVNIIQTCSSKKAADAAKDSVDLARKNAHFDQRAWLGVSYGTYNYAVNQVFGATYEVIDTGKTPARKVHGMAVACFMKSGDTPSFVYEHGTSVDLGTMLPGVHQGAVSWLIPANARKGDHVQPMKISEAMRRDLRSGKGYILVYGKINYDSVFGAHHWIKFCASSGPTTFTQPKECVDYNDVDSNEEP